MALHQPCPFRRAVTALTYQFQPLLRLRYLIGLDARGGRDLARIHDEPFLDVGARDHTIVTLGEQISREHHGTCRGDKTLCSPVMLLVGLRSRTEFLTFSDGFLFGSR